MIIIAIAYLLGSIPAGLLLAKLKGIDLRAGGSGNIGATNALRLGGKLLGASTLLLDASKGIAAVYIAAKFQPDMINLAALSAVLGHIYPVWLKFKGGKGVATAIGVILFLNYQIFLIAISAWLLTFKAKKISSLAALAGCFCAGISCIWLAHDQQQGLTITAILTLIVCRHSENIKRLLAGEELAFKEKEK